MFPNLYWKSLCGHAFCKQRMPVFMTLCHVMDYDERTPKQIKLI